MDVRETLILLSEQRWRATGRVVTPGVCARIGIISRAG